MKPDQSMELLRHLQSSPVPLGATQLSDMTGIPSATVGRMLARLEQDSKVEKVSNRGRRLTSFGENYLEATTVHTSKMSVADKLIWLVRDDSIERMYEVQQTRKLLESHTIDLAARNATPEDVQVLEDILSDYAYEIRHGNPHSETDVRLHLHIAKMSGNATIHQILMLILQDDSKYYAHLSAAMRQNVPERIDQHRVIVDAIRDRQPEKAVAAMRQHLDTIFKTPKDGAAETASEPVATPSR